MRFIGARVIVVNRKGNRMAKTGMNIAVTDEERGKINRLRELLGLNNQKAAIMVAVNKMLRQEDK